MMRFSPFACRGNWFIVGWLAGERMGQGVLPAALLQKLVGRRSERFFSFGQVVLPDSPATAVTVEGLFS